MENNLIKSLAYLSQVYYCLICFINYNKVHFSYNYHAFLSRTSLKMPCLIYEDF